MYYILISLQNVVYIDIMLLKILWKSTSPVKIRCILQYFYTDHKYDILLSYERT